jgi:hypothetical protein
MGYFLATSFVALSMLVFFFAASDIAVDAVAPMHQLRFLPSVTNWELLVGRADCSCSYVWTQSSGTALSRWVLHHLLSLVTVWQMLVIWWRVYGGYLSSTWIVSGESQARASRPPPYTTGTLCDIHIHMRAHTHTHATTRMIEILACWAAVARELCCEGRCIRGCRCIRVRCTGGG